MFKYRKEQYGTVQNSVQSTRQADDYIIAWKPFFHFSIWISRWKKHTFLIYNFPVYAKEIKFVYLCGKPSNHFNICHLIRFWIFGSLYTFEHIFTLDNTSCKIIVVRGTMEYRKHVICPLHKTLIWPLTLNGICWLDMAWIWPLRVSYGHGHWTLLVSVRWWSRWLLNNLETWIPKWSFTYKEKFGQFKR